MHHKLIFKKYSQSHTKSSYQLKFVLENINLATFSPNKMRNNKSQGGKD